MKTCFVQDVFKLFVVNEVALEQDFGEGGSFFILFSPLLHLSTQRGV
jgi:hypothetical protein